MPLIKKHSIDFWVADFDDFSRDFRDYVKKYFSQLSLRVDIDENHLELVHTQWSGDYQHFQTFEFQEEAEHLSPIKAMALLVCVMSKLKIFDKIYLVNATDDSNLSDHVKDLLGAPEAVVSLDFALSVIGWFETRRTDKQTPYKYCISPALRSDIIRFIKNTNAEKGGMILMFKALFCRP